MDGLHLEQLPGSTSGLFTTAPVSVSMVVTVVPGRPELSTTVVMMAARLMVVAVEVLAGGVQRVEVPTTVIGVPTVRPVAVSTTATVVRAGTGSGARRLGDHKRARTILVVLHRIH